MLDLWVTTTCCPMSIKKIRKVIGCMIINGMFFVKCQPGSLVECEILTIGFHGVELQCREWYWAAWAAVDLSWQISVFQGSTGIRTRSFPADFFGGKIGPDDKNNWKLCYSQTVHRSRMVCSKTMFRCPFFLFLFQSTFFASLCHLISRHSVVYMQKILNFEDRYSDFKTISGVC